MTPSLVTRARSLLAADAAVLARVGARIYATVAKQGTALPCLVCTSIDEGDDTMADGSNSNLAPARLQVDCYSKVSNEEAEQMAEEVRQVLCRTTAPFTARRVGKRTLPDPSDRELSRISSDFKIFAKEK